MPLFAPAALSAALFGQNDAGLTFLQSFHAFSHLFDDAASLVTRNQRRLAAGVSSLIGMQVGAADAGVVHTDKNFSRTDFGDGQGNDATFVGGTDFKSLHNIISIELRV